MCVLFVHIDLKKLFILYTLYLLVYVYVCTHKNGTKRQTSNEVCRRRKLKSYNHIALLITLLGGKIIFKISAIHWLFVNFMCLPSFSWDNNRVIEIGLVRGFSLFLKYNNYTKKYNVNKDFVIFLFFLQIANNFCFR